MSDTDKYDKLLSELYQTLGDDAEALQALQRMDHRKGPPADLEPLPVARRYVSEHQPESASSNDRNAELASNQPVASGLDTTITQPADPVKNERPLPSRETKSKAQRSVMRRRNFFGITQSVLDRPSMDDVAVNNLSSVPAMIVRAPDANHWMMFHGQNETFYVYEHLRKMFPEREAEFHQPITIKHNQHEMYGFALPPKLMLRIVENPQEKTGLSLALQTRYTRNQTEFQHALTSFANGHSLTRELSTVSRY